MPENDYVYVDSAASLAALTDRLQTASRLVLDTEADSFHHYFEKVCLIQLAVDDDLYLVDPLVELDLQPTFAAIARHRIVLHGADYDLRLLRQGYGFRPEAGIFDTVLAAQLLGIAAFGLAALVDRYAGVKLDKGDTRSDWSQRPLTSQQIAYALDDVRYLGQVADNLAAELRAAGRDDWHRQACEALIEATASDRVPDPDAEWRIKGIYKLPPRELAFVRALWHWRDREARRIDRPAFMIMGNHQLVDLAIDAARMPGDQALPDVKLPKNIRGPRLDALRQAIARTQHLPAKDYPGPPKQTDEYWSRLLADELKALKKRLDKVAAELGIDPPVIASRSSLAEILRVKANTLEAVRAAGRLQPWQAELVLPLL